MNYQEAIKFLYSQLPMYHRIGKAAYKSDLKNIIDLDDYFNHPHRKFLSIHVAGTNGKGSVSHYLASVLQSAGYRTGLYTSPHLKDFRERIRINGVPVPEEPVVKFIGENMQLFQRIQPSFFEMTVALAFQYFYLEQVDVAVVEVGLGGRLDSTNIISPVLSVITNIGLDHTDLLGDTFEKIAFEKAGIIKPGIPVVIGETNDMTKEVFFSKAKNENARIFFADQVYSASFVRQTNEGMQVLRINKSGIVLTEELLTGLLGRYQLKNIPVVLQAVDLLNNLGFSVSDDAIFRGIRDVVTLTGLLGRWQVIGHDPLIICDTGHNEEGIRAVIGQLKTIPYNKLHIIFGMVSDKNACPVLGLLPKDACYYFCKADIPRAMDENLLQRQAGRFNLYGKSFASVTAAFTAAKSSADVKDLIFVGGSTFVVAEVL